MVDTVRTISALLTTVFQDAQGSFPITANDLRDFVVTTQRRTPVFNVMWSEYGAVGDGTTDDKAAIQAANDACAAAGGGVVFFPKPTVAYGVKSLITMSPGVVFLGEARGQGYFDGWDGYLGTANTGTTCRIKAIATWTSGDAPLIQCDSTDTSNAARAKGFGAAHLIFDANNLASEVFQFNPSGFKERFLTLDDCTLMRSGGAGVRDCLNMQNGMLKLTRCNIFSSGRYGIYMGGGVTDSYIADCYIHSNPSGGVYAANPALMQLRGGKIEENFGPGIQIDNNSASGANFRVYGVDFQHNTAEGIRCGGAGGAGLCLMKVDHCLFAQNGYTNTLGPGSQLHADTANGRIVADNCVFLSAGISPYHIGSTGSAKVWHRNSVYMDTALTTNTFTATSGTITADGGSLTSIA